MNVAGLSPIEMIIIVNGRRTVLKLPMKAEPERFRHGADEITAYMLEQRKRVDRTLTQMLRDNVELTSDNLKWYLKNGAGCQKIYTLRILFDEYLSIMKKRIGRDLTKDTYNRYVKTTEMFVACNGITDALPAKDIGLTHFLDYQAELNKKLDAATSCNYLQKIKTIFRYAFETGKIPSNPAYGLKIDKGVKDTVLYLTDDELRKIESHSFGRRLQEVADVFLFSCYTGLSFADIAELGTDDYRTNTAGYTFVDKTRKKTGVRFCAILLGNSDAILKKYNCRLPCKSNQRTNEYLKEIQEICGIEKPLHFHMARHTAASLLLNHRPAIPNETIKRIMGWKDDRQLRHYATIFNQTVFDDIQNAFGKAPSKPAGELKGKKCTVPPSHSRNDGISPDLDDMEYFCRVLGIDGGESAKNDG